MHDCRILTSREQHPPIRSGCRNTGRTGGAPLALTPRSVGPAGTVLVMVVALLAMLAMMATTFLVTSRYDQISVSSAGVDHQMEMLLGMLEGDIRHKLAEDLWGLDVGQNSASDGANEGYDGPDNSHGWLNGVCGGLIEWEPSSGSPPYAQAVVGNASDWHDLAGTDDSGLALRYAVVIQDLGGLVNVNVARQPDPDMMGNTYPVSPDSNAPEVWPYTIWAFHAMQGHADWGYWWWTGDKRFEWSTPVNFFAGFGKAIRGGGPAQQADIRWLLADPSQVNLLDNYLRKYFTEYKDYARSFDIQDELDLRFPGIALDGAPYASVIERTVPSLFSAAQPTFNSEQIPGHRRRFATAIARTTNWQRRREPVRMHPYDEDFWNQPGVSRALCDEAWYFIFDEPRNDDLLKYFNEARMGYRIPLQRGTTLSRMWPDDPYDILVRMDPDVYGDNSFPALSAVQDFPASNSSGTYTWRAAPPFQYDDYLTQYELRIQWPRREGDYQYAKDPSMMALLLANTMAVMGVPDPSKDPDQAASYEPQPFAHKVAQKNARFDAYCELAGIFHLNLSDYQDPNGIPGLLYPYNKDGQLQRYNRYGQRAGAEDRPYMTEVVVEFESWPDYAVISADVYAENNLTVSRVDKGTSADLRGLLAGDVITAVRLPPAATFATFATFQDFRNLIQKVPPGGTIDLRVTRAGATVEVNGVTMEPAVKTIAVELHNPHDHAIELSNNVGSNSGLQRYNVAVPQQYDAANGKRGLLCRSPLNNPLPQIPAQGCLLLLEQRGLYWTSRNSTNWTRLTSWMSSHGLNGIPWYGTNKDSHYSKNAVVGETSNLVNLRAYDGEVVLVINNNIGNWSAFGYASDAVRNRATYADAPPMPVTGANPGTPKGVADMFEEARSRMLAGNQNPVVRLYRPLYMESRATQFLTASDSWMIGGQRSAAASRLGTRGADEDDFQRTVNTDYVNVDARGFLISTSDHSFRYGADLARVTRLTQPGLFKPYGRLGMATVNPTAARDQENLWLADRPYGSANENDPAPQVPTEFVDRVLRGALAAINGLSGGKGVSSQEVRRLLQKAEARLRFSPYTPTTPAEIAECSAWYDFIDAFSMGGAAYDNIDNNGTGVADEHGTLRYDLGIPDDLMETDPGGGWLLEHSNCWPAYGRINVNTAPREVLRNSLMAPSADARRALGDAIWSERGGEASQSNASYRPFKNLVELYGRVSALNGQPNGFDRYGFDGLDNHSGSGALPDMPPEPRALIDDLEERNYLWRINSELITLRSDTFAAYLRLQARRQTGGTWKVVSERRVYSIWDRARCLWPPKRHDGMPHQDFVAPQRLGIQIFSY